MGRGYYMQGIYMWTNKINNKKYIGKSKNLANRKRGYRNEINRGSNRPIIKEMRNIGINIFEYTILEKCDNFTEDKLLKREQFWMDYYNTQDKNYGYNVLDASNTISSFSNIGSSNSKAILNEEEVLEIRKSIYIEEIPPYELYKIYKDKISYDTFCKAYRGETWKNVDLSMVKPRKIKRKGIKKAKLTKEEVVDIRKRFANKESITDIFQNYIGICTRNTVKRIVEYKTWKNI